MFADDSTIVFECNDENNFECEINNDLDKIIQWLQINKLVVNLDKTKIMNFKQRESKKTVQVKVHHSGKQIEEVSSTKFLGIHIDNNMRWETHTNYICGKLNKFSYALYMLNRIANRFALMASYHAYVASILRYGILFWGNTSNKEGIFRAQKNCVRAICSLRPTDSCRPYFKELKIMTVPCIYIYEVCIFVRCNLTLFETFSSLRHKDKLRQIPHKTALFQNNMYGIAPTLYNKLPKDIKVINNLMQYKL